MLRRSGCRCLLEQVFKSKQLPPLPQLRRSTAEASQAEENLSWEEDLSLVGNMEDGLTISSETKPVKMSWKLNNKPLAYDDDLVDEVVQDWEEELVRNCDMWDSLRDDYRERVEKIMGVDDIEGVPITENLKGNIAAKFHVLRTVEADFGVDIPGSMLNKCNDSDAIADILLDQEKMRRFLKWKKDRFHPKNLPPNLNVELPKTYAHNEWVWMAAT